MSDTRKSNAASSDADIASLSEEAVIEQIIEWSPEGIKSHVRSALMDTTKVIQSDRAELAGLFARLVDIRYARGAEGRKDDGGKPLLLLREADATSGDLQMG